MSLRTNVAALVLGLALSAAAACGGSSNSESTGAEAGAGTGADPGGGDGGTNGKGGSGVGGTTGKGGSGAGGTSSGGAAGTSSGGVGATSGTGGTATGGVGAAAGAGGCGPCLRIACAPPVNFTVVPNVDAGATSLGGVKVNIPGISLSCTPSGGTPCQWFCQAFQFGLSGHYTATISAPGYETKTVEFDLTPPTNCGCCGCGCGATFQQTVALDPSGEPMPGCCAALDRDPGNCGTCGNTCASGSCVDGECAQ